MRPTKSATYVYCLVRSARAPAMTRAPAPLPEMGKVRALDAGRGVWLIVSDAPVDAYGEAPLNEKLKDVEWVSACALAHEAVIEHARKARSLIPLKLFTLFHDDARALAWVASDRRRLERVLDRLEGCAEFGVRMTLDENRARAEADARARKAAKPAGGAAFLMRKKEAKERVIELTRGAQVAAAELFEELSNLAAESRRRAEVEGLSPGSRLVLDGVFLVDQKRSAKFRAKVKAAAKALEQRGYDVVLNGPWPPYHFVAEAA